MLAMKSWALATIISLSLFSSCKTREDIVREQMVDNMSIQMQDGQKLNADFSVRVQNMEDRLNDLSGKLEEGQHDTKTSVDDKIKNIQEKITILETSQNKQGQSLDSLHKEIAAQKKYIQEVLGTLKKISQKKSKSHKKQSPYNQAMSLYHKRKYKEAKSILVGLIDKKMPNSEKARVIHNLGMIAYINKENDKALAYFSRLFTEFPKKGYNKNGLMFLAKTLKRMNKNEEAKQALNELISRFPKARQVAQAKKMLQKL